MINARRRATNCFPFLQRFAFIIPFLSDHLPFPHHSQPFYPVFRVFRSVYSLLFIHFIRENTTNNRFLNQINHTRMTNLKFFYILQEIFYSVNPSPYLKTILEFDIFFISFFIFLYFLNIYLFYKNSLSQRKFFISQSVLIWFIKYTFFLLNLCKIKIPPL